MRFGLRAQIGLVLVAIMVITVALVGVAAVNLMKRAVYDQLAMTGERSARMVGAVLEVGVDFDRAPSHPLNVQALSRACSRLIESGSAYRIDVFDTEGAAIARCGDSPPVLGEWPENGRDLGPGIETGPVIRWVDDSHVGLSLIVTDRLNREDGAWATVQTQFAHDRLAARLHTAQLLTLAYVILDALLLLIVGYLLLTRIIVAPIRRIGLATERLAAGDYTSHVDISSHNEIGTLAESFNHMVDHLNQNRQDLEERMEALEAAKHDLEQAQSAIIRSEKLASVGRLATGIAHEVGNPLSALLGFVEILRADPKLDLSARIDILARLETELLRIHEIIRRLLDYSRREGDQAASASLSEVIQSAEQLVSTQPRFRDIELRLDIPDDLPRIQGNPDRLLQVFINLLFNAADAIESTGWIQVVACCDGQGVQVSVCDSGTGIEPELAGQIFEPFFTTKPPGKGTGLGLAISESIIDGCGGSLRVDAQPGEGACFRVWLPRTDPGQP